MSDILWAEETLKNKERGKNMSVFKNAFQLDCERSPISVINKGAGKVHAHEISDFFANEEYDKQFFLVVQ